jgi:hypothetical protein
VRRNIFSAVDFFSDNFCHMRKVYTKGQGLARKQILMAAAAYNLKKLMKAMGFKGVIAAAAAAINAVSGKAFAYVELFLSGNKFLAMR